MSEPDRVLVFSPRAGVVHEVASDRFQCRLWSVLDTEAFTFEFGTTYGFVQRGPAVLVVDDATYPLATGQYFSVPGRATVRADDPRAAIIGVSQQAVDGFFQLGGPIEARGRLRYIDGCTDSLLVPPVVRGDPCLNLLHIPPGTEQSAHTHPSFRAGIIAAGRGRCIIGAGAIPLEAGLLFVIPEGVVHSFHTTDEALSVIAFHPDSDFGPTHETHPMINRTIPVTP